MEMSVSDTLGSGNTRPSGVMSVGSHLTAPGWDGVAAAADVCGPSTSPRSATAAARRRVLRHVALIMHG